FTVTAGVGVAAIIAVVVVIIIVANHSSHSPVAGGGPGSAVSATPTSTRGNSHVSTASGAVPKRMPPASASVRGPSVGSATAAAGTQAGGQSPASSTPSGAQGSASTGPNPTDSVVICVSADFNQKANICRKADSQVSAGNGGLTVDGDLSFPDYMSGTINLLQKKGTGWHRLGGFSTKTYPDVVVIDSNKFISVQLANVFSYGGHRAMPKCSTDWGVEVDDAQGLPLGEVKFTYLCA
ncbi:MAG: hypothetical protein ACRDG4_14410, partial [Chloroflexota bacterium]